MYPTFVHFLLQFSNNDLNSVPQLIGDLRKTLRFNNPNTNRTANDLIQRAIFDRIFTALIQSKKLYDIWLKSIQNASETEREPTVDVLVLLVMQSVNDEKRNFIENVVSVSKWNTFITQRERDGFNYFLLFYSFASKSNCFNSPSII